MRTLLVKHICLILERVTIGLENTDFFAVDFARLRAVIHCNMLPCQVEFINAIDGRKTVFLGVDTEGGE